MRYVRFFWFLARQMVIVEYRYPVQALGNLLVGMIFFGALAAGGQFSGRSLDQSTVVLFAALLMAGAMQGMVRYLDTKHGDLEELFLFPTRPLSFVLTAGVGSLIGAMVPFLVLFLLLGLVLRIDLTAFQMILPVLPANLLFMMGLGLVLAGLMLIFKRLGALVQIISMSILALTLAPRNMLAGFEAVFPATWILVAVQGQEVDYLTLWSSSVLYFGLGILAFRLSERFSVRRGLIGVR